MSRRRSPLVFLTVLALTAPWACADATDVELLEIEASGGAVGLAFLDLDADGTLSFPDLPLEDVVVTLVVAGSAEVVDEVTTDTLGGYAFEEVPVGAYEILFEASALGDSLFQVAPVSPVTVELGQITQANAGVRFEELSVEEVLVAPAGRRITTSGIALNRRFNSGPGQVHFQGDSAFLRGLNVARGGINPGDSVQILGRIVSDNGRPALDSVTYVVLLPQAQVPDPAEVTTGVAAMADDGPLDAALVRIRTAEISDTSTTADGDFRFWADDGSDSVEVVIREFLVPTITTTLFRPDTIVRVQQLTGLLSPFDDAGSVRWRVLPRDGNDITLETKTATVGVATTYDTASASLGDTVEIEVVVANGGPHAATGVQVADTIPAGLSFLSASTTRGSFDDATALWDLGGLAASAADTLRIQVEVTAAGPAFITNRAWFLGLVLEVDLSGTGDDVASAGLSIN